MLTIEIPGRPALRLEHVVFDFNGTLACDGILYEGLAERLVLLSAKLQLHVVTGDTFGKAAEQLAGLPCKLTVLPSSGQSEAKLAYVESLGRDRTATIGNGFNDRLMLNSACLSIAVLQDEGLASASLMAADIVVRHIVDAIELFLNPLRLVATLRQ